MLKKIYLPFEPLHLERIIEGTKLAHNLNSCILEKVKKPSGTMGALYELRKKIKYLMVFFFPMNGNELIQVTFPGLFFPA